MYLKLIILADFNTKIKLIKYHEEKVKDMKVKKIKTSGPSQHLTTLT